MNESPSALDVTVSIVAYRADAEELGLAIQSAARTSLRVRVVVVDNSPTTALEGPCRARGAVYIFTGSNLGFGAGHNIALERFKDARYHLVLNPDVVFEPAALEELVAFMDRNPSVGHVMPRVMYPDGSTQHLCKLLPTPFDVFARRLFPGSMKERFAARLAAYEMAGMDMTRVLSVPFLSGCFMLLRRSVLDRVGGFDDRYFMYFEDVDLSRRIHRESEGVYYPGATIVHRHEKGSYKSRKIFFISMQSAVRYFNKWGWYFDRERDKLNASAGPVQGLK